MEPEPEVGLSCLRDQVRRRVNRQGLAFSLMTVGQSGLGKSTLINSIFFADILSREVVATRRTVEVERHDVVLEEDGVKLFLSVVDTPGFEDSVDNTDCWEPIISYVEEQFNVFLEAETRVARETVPDTRIHACLYFLPATGHGLRNIDLECLRRLQEVVNIIPVIGKSDTLTKEELHAFKLKIRNQLEESQIKLFSSQDLALPFAVVGSNVVVEDEEGRMVRGRKYPWGTVNIEDQDHCDFTRLRSFILSGHMQDMKDRTNRDFYERFRRRKLASVMEDSVTAHPLALMETEKIGFEDRLEKMSEEMNDALARSVKEHEERMRRFEREAEEKIDREREALEEERTKINTKREELENEIDSFVNRNGFEMSQFLSTSTESLTKKKGYNRWIKF